MSVLYPSEKTSRVARHAYKLKPCGMSQPTSREAPTRFERLCRAALVARLQNVTKGQLLLADAERQFSYGTLHDDETAARIEVRDPRFYRHAALGGTMGAAEAYIRGYWESDDLIAVMRLMARNAAALSEMERGVSRLVKPLLRVGHWLTRNTLVGSQRNIAAHYDLSNEFFATFLDPTMTYSSGLFEQPETTLAEASLAKYERLCQLLDLKPHDHLLEIGTGWGGFACYAAHEYGCRVTTTTISKAQHDYAKQQIAAAGLEKRVELLRTDYRQLQGSFDKIVSIEMIEAVGHEFLGTFFGKCDELLRPGGSLALQAITMPEQRYERYRRSVDFIQRYVFPGGCLPSVGALVAATERTSLQLTTLDDFGQDYARTLEIWRENFHANLDVIRELGMTERLLRTWHYYFCYCEAAFREQLIGLKQMVFVKPGR